MTVTGSFCFVVHCGWQVAVHLIRVRLSAKFGKKVTVTGCRSIPMYIPTRQAQKHATIATLNFTVGMMHVHMMYCIWFHKRVKPFLFTQMMLFYKHAHPGFLEVPDETKRRETPNSIFGDEANPSLKNNFESSGFDRFLFIKFSMVKMGLQLIAWMEFHPQKW